MAKCLITVCPRRATWEGTLSYPELPQFDREIAYCDEHAWMQINRTPDGLVMTLTPIGQGPLTPVGGSA